MGKVKTKYIVRTGASKYIQRMNELAEESDEIMGRTLYEGAKIIADEIRASIQNLPVRDSKKRYSPDNPAPSITQAQKDGLLSGLGISHMDSSEGVWNIKIGMDHYNSTVTKRWPNGQPNAMILRSLESGTSFLKKNPIIAKTVRANREKADQAMGKKLDEEIAKHFGQ